MLLPTADSTSYYEATTIYKYIFIYCLFYTLKEGQNKSRLYRLLESVRQFRIKTLNLTPKFMKLLDKSPLAYDLARGDFTKKQNKIKVIVINKPDEKKAKEKIKELSEHLSKSWNEKMNAQ